MVVRGSAAQLEDGLMRTAIFAGVSTLALAAASPLFAQATVPADCAGVTGNCSVIDTVGHNNEAVVDQDGTGDVSEILQDATGADANVTQNGSGNTATVTQ